MDNVKATKNQKEITFPATIVKVIDDCKVVINRGALHKVTEGQQFLLYKLSEEEIKDPISGKSLGYLEIVKGTGKIIHVQERISTIESDKREPSERRIVRKRSSSPFFSAFTGEEEEETIVPSGRLVPFDDPVIGDKAKPI
jgi:DNA gyrase/topoisomerase IV subunit B